jgi:aspartate kinase
MALIVQKYGGTSVADPERIRAVAEHIAYTKSHGNQVVAVVSAMGKSTDNLINLANQVSKTHPGREMDMLLTTGERISMALFTQKRRSLKSKVIVFVLRWMKVACALWLDFKV